MLCCGALVTLVVMWETVRHCRPVRLARGEERFPPITGAFTRDGCRMLI
jgi:hypothetical protein